MKKETQSLKNAIKNRRTVREFKNKRVSRKDIRRIIESARWAPSPHNLQPWKYVVCEGETKKNISGILGDYRKGEPLLMKLILKESVRIIDNASVVIVVYRKIISSRKFEKFSELVKGDLARRRRWLEILDTQEVQSVACGVQNMLLTAHDIGLGTTWLGVPLVREKAINDLLGENDSLAAVIAVGYPAKESVNSKRKSMTEIVSFV